MFRLCAQRLKWPKWVVLRHTMSQVANALRPEDDASDPHAGNVKIRGLAHLESILKGYE